MSVYTQHIHTRSPHALTFALSHLHTHTTDTATSVRLLAHKHKLLFPQVSLHGQALFGQLTPQPTPGISLTTAPPPPPVSPFSFSMQPWGFLGGEESPGVAAQNHSFPSST